MCPLIKCSSQEDVHLDYQNKSVGPAHPEDGCPTAECRLERERLLAALRRCLLRLSEVAVASVFAADFPVRGLQVASLWGMRRAKMLV
jgi:hypothetical protein